MKAKNIMNIPISDTETLIKNTEVEIVDSYCGCDGYYYTCIIPDNRQININSNLLEVIDYTPYINWERERIEISKAVLQGFLSNPANIKAERDNIIKYAIGFADALIEELKKKRT